MVKRIMIFGFLMFAQSASKACDCKQMSPLTIVECIKFDAILQCKIDSVSNCDTRSIAYAHCIETYKGEFTDAVALNFDCSTSCQLSFAKDEVWLIYGKLNDKRQLELNFCDRNRKSFANPKEDYFAINTGLSFTDEIAYLKKNIGLKVKQVSSQTGNSIDITQRENSRTTGSNNLLLLFASLVLFLIFYYIVNKKIK